MTWFAQVMASPLTLLTLLMALSTLPSPPHGSSHPRLHRQQRDVHVRYPTMEVSAICYQCAAMHGKPFYAVHDPCCLEEGPVRARCRDWYVELPRAR
ncbi:hypothetical protein ACOMHN_028413 [Nucella lapillus]